MEQIYYTQCPIGYGLGASNGFQVKRLSPGYPLTGDFRHLGLRAHLPGSRALAPATLRYRLGEGGLAEVAFLSPRSHEYETERGLWGRPGGHFAHGLRLEGDELATLGHWPAGLFGSAFWRRADPEPSLGRPPEPLSASADLLGRAPAFETASALAPRLPLDLLAVLLTALAVSARDGRTLVLVDRPERLADHIAVLTLAFPEVWRGALTFSTYHDRPDELSGFRLQGTAPDPRLNRQGLSSMGFLADLTAGTVEPAVPPADWARTLAGWLVGGSDADRAAWESTGRRASATSAAVPDPGAFPADDWLDPLYALPGQLRPQALPPTDAPGWAALAGLAAWARRAGSGREPAAARPSAWWRAAVADGDDARRALVAHLAMPEGWDGDGAGPGWGAAVSVWLDACPADRRLGLFASAVAASPNEARPAFLRGLLATAAPEVARDGLRWLKAQPGVDPFVLLPMEVRGLGDRLAGPSARRAFREILTRAAPSRAALAAVLDAIADEARARPAVRPEAARAVADVLATADEKTTRAALRWALAAGRSGEGWLVPHLRSLAAGLDGPERWAELSRLVEASQAGAFARVALDVAAGPGGGDRLFRWAVETLLLPLPATGRPHDPRWPGAYLDRTGSGLDLVGRLFTREFRHLGLRDWLAAARDRGELSDEQAARVEGAARYARALKGGDARALLRVDLPAVPPAERGELLAQILSYLGPSSADGIGFALDCCRSAWPEGFRPGAEGLEGIAAVVADWLRADREAPDVWLARLVAVLDRLNLRAGGVGGFEPDGLAAEVLAATSRLGPDGASPWRLRQSVFGRADAWRALGADVRHDLRGRTAAESAACFERWDRALTKGVHASRFFEVWLNSCDGPALAATVPACVGDLKTLPDLPWWRSADHPGARDDLREAFARLAPMAPLVGDALTAVQGWMRTGSRAGPAPSTGPVAVDDLVAIDDGPTTVVAPTARPAPPALSGPARGRWRCVEALSALSRPGLGDDARWQTVDSWVRDLPLATLAAHDRDLFVSWLVFRLDTAEPDRVARLAAWLVGSGMTDAEAVTGWADRLGPWAEVPDGLRVARLPFVSDLKAEWRAAARAAAGRRPKSAEPGSPSTP